MKIPMWLKEWFLGERFYVWAFNGRLQITNNWPQDDGILDNARGRNFCRIGEGIARPLERPNLWLMEEPPKHGSIRGVIESRDITDDEWNSRSDRKSGYEQ